MDAIAKPPQPARRSIGFRELVGLVASLMAVNALAIDVMLPALPAIGRSLGVTDENQRQWIITAYLLGFGIAHLFWGPIADRFGRRPVLIAALLLNFIFCTGVMLSGSLEQIVAARFLHGMAAAGSRVVAISIVRDRFSGRQMARVISLAFIVFLAVPVLAPSIGQAVMHFFSWQSIFGGLCLWLVIVLIWVTIRLPETLHPEFRMTISVKHWLRATTLVLTERNSIGYTVALALLSGALFGFINCAQQVFYDVFRAPGLFVYAFAGVAATMGVASYFNSRVVERYGTRRMSHSALLGFVAITMLHAVIALSGHETLASFVVLQGLMMACFGMASSNFGSMAMEKVGEVAGTAASVQGFINTAGGAVLGSIIGQSFNGTTVPLAIGYAAMGILTLLAVLWTERGRLFRPHNEAASA